MKKGILLLLLTAVMIVGLLGQDSPVLMTIGDEKVSVEEFERIYRKNNNPSSLNQQSPEEYLELFINFKLKVKEAESLGMDEGGIPLVQVRCQSKSYSDPAPRKSGS